MGKGWKGGGKGEGRGEGRGKLSYTRNPLP